MKTKTLFTVFFVFTFIVSTNTFSQVYHPFLNHSSWLLNTGTGCCLPSTDIVIKEGTDTIIASKNYVKFIDSGSPVFIRENITERKVYKLVDGKDVLLYDYTLSSGDTITIGANHYTATVNQVAVNGGFRKRIRLDSKELYCGQTVYQVWIEGVGGEEHPFFPGYNMIGRNCSSQGGFWKNTICSFQNGVHIYGNADCSSLQTDYQTYHPLLNNSSWRIQEFCETQISKTIEKATDEVINSVTYKKFIDPFAVGGTTTDYLREDVANQKVYKLVNGKEILLYDFSLEDGSKILYGGYNYTAKIDYILINGGIRKRITLRGDDIPCLYFEMSWIEGVGTDRHPFYPDFNMEGPCSTTGSCSISTICSFQNGVHVFGNSECIPQEEYHPLLNKSSWTITNIVACCQPAEKKTIEEGTEVVIGGITYIKFLNPYITTFPSNAEVYLREDKNERKVYHLVNGTEVLLYDFSLKDSDTIILNGITFTATVDSITVNGGTRKRITLKSDVNALFCGKSATQVWIEGVGSVAHPLDPGSNINAESCSSGGSYLYTTCSFQDGVQIFGSSNCSEVLSTQDIASEAQGIDVFPNPANDMVQVRLQNRGETLDSVALYDITGKLIQKASGIATSESSLSLGSLAKGLYLLEITTQSQMKTTKKLIVN